MHPTPSTVTAYTTYRFCAVGSGCVCTHFFRGVSSYDFLLLREYPV